MESDKREEPRWPCISFSPPLYLPLLTHKITSLSLSLSHTQAAQTQSSALFPKVPLIIIIISLRRRQWIIWILPIPTGSYSRFPTTPFSNPPPVLISSFSSPFLNTNSSPLFINTINFSLSFSQGTHPQNGDASDRNLPVGGPKLEDFLGGPTVAQFDGGPTMPPVEMYDESELKSIAATFIQGFSTDQTQKQLAVAPPPKKAVETFGQRTSIFRGVTRYIYILINI